MRLPILTVLAFVVAATGMALAANHGVPRDNGTTFPEPEEATERGPRDDTAVSWFPAGVTVVFLAAASGVIFYMWRSNRKDRRRGLR